MRWFKSSNLLLFLIIAYFVPFVIRCSLAYVAKENPEYLFSNKIIALWTADAGLYGYYAKQLLHGAALHFSNETALGYLLYWISKGLHIDLDTLIFYLPGFLAPLIVIPTLLIFWLYDIRKVGLFAALIGAIAMNYYFRTHLGYCDTDMLIFPLYFTLLFSMIGVVERGIRYAIIGTIAITLLILFYHSAKPIVYGSLLFFTLYIVLFERKNQNVYFGAVVLFVAALPIEPLYSFVLSIGVYLIALFISSKWRVDYRIFMALFFLIALGVSFVAMKQGYFQRAFEYLNKKQEYVLKDKSKSKIELEATLKTIAESRSITFKELITYSSGNIVVFLLGSLGLFLLVSRRKSAIILLLPYVVGLLSLKAGVRFVTFMVPVIVIGNIYFFYIIQQRFTQKSFASCFFYIPTFSILLFYINIVNSYNHMLAPFFKKGELQAIKTVLNNSDKGYIITWWDYGWPLWYYTNKRTIIDNGKHHWDNYIVAKSLFSSDSDFVANFDRFFIERYDKIYPWSILPYILNRYSMEDLLKKIREGKLKEEKHNEIYYYFDDKILTKLPVIENFAYTKEEKKKRGFIWIDKVRVITTRSGLVQGQEIMINLKSGILHMGKRSDRIGKIVFHDGEKIVRVDRFRRDPYTIIVYKNRYIIGTVGYNESFFFQAFFYHNLDRRHFQSLIYNKDAKIYRLRS